jgi:predicted TPR repeat methyltransferase
MPTTEPTAAMPAAASAQAWLSRAMAAHQQGQVDEARRAYSALLALAPEHPDGLHLLGMLEAQFGSGDSAVALISRAIALNPAEPMFHNNLGNALLQMGREAEADACYERALKIDPKRYDALNNRALLMARRDDLLGAEAAFTQLLEIAPGFTDARQNMVLVCLRLKRLDDALAHCVAGLVTAPQARGLRELLGRAYVRCQLPDKAREVYRAWIEDDPDDPVPRHHLAALEGQTPERASDAYVERTFDDFAGSFDQILGRLDYRAPALVGAALRARLDETPAPRWRVLDAGCGTGLCAEHLAPHARSLVGVDLSRRMLERAAQRNHYTALHQEELVAFLQAQPQAFDVIASADTLCYFGALEAFAAASQRALDGTGWLIFTVESHEESAGAPDYRLYSHGRYSHRRDYVHAVLGQAGFQDVQTEAAVLRHELQDPVQGWLVSARL